MRPILQDYWQFQLPTRIICGQGTAGDLEKEIMATGAKNVFFVTDQTMLHCGLLEQVTSKLRQLKPVGFFTEVLPNSEVSQAEEGARAAKNAGADFLVALGGGSCIDTAKAINIVLSLGGSLLDYEGFNQINQPLMPLAAIPTTAGTGSEVTQYSVILCRQRKNKLTFLSPYLTPTLAILDPELTVSLPSSLTASTGLDALAHAVESYVSLSGSNLARGLAVEACELIFSNLEKAVAYGADLEARQAMLLASNLAGIAFSNTMVGCVHAMAHALGGLYGIPHGVAVGLLLPHGIIFNGMSEGYKAYSGLAGKLFGEYGTRAPVDLAEKIWSLLNNCGLPHRLSSLGLEEKDLAAVAEEAISDGAMYTNPREAESSDLLNILKSAL